MKFLLQNKLAFLLVLPFGFMLTLDILQIALVSLNIVDEVALSDLLTSRVPQPVRVVFVFTALVGILLYLVQLVKHNKKQG